ncbi:related to transposase [Sporisorium reilianum f. sp. reilianum]|uniref:Related to transposase n=1 Tax=Sporisorium reilianum f. sp. reilianum TaxID=72559 RepID=A0A2N8UJK7_9BASI|nr:related to transposase [Sporisorium reilianum f. sp. reilianum]
MPRTSTKKKTHGGCTETAATTNDHEEKLQCALAKYEAGQHASIAAAAAAHSIPKSMLFDRSKGMTAKADTHTSQQALLLASENILLKHIWCSAATGFPLNPADVWEFAQTLAHGSTNNSGSAKLGTNWVLSFLICHLSIQSTWSRCLENACIRGTDEKSIRDWFGWFQNAISEYKISSNNIFNMDETGFVFGLGSSQQVIVPGSDPASQFKAQPGNHQNATVIKAIGSGGQVLPPLIITKGKLHTVGNQQQMVDIPTMWHFLKGPSGWTDNELAVLWVENIFDVNMRPSMPSEHHLLIINGHVSHTSSTFLDALWRKNIIPICLPAHATHIMQPLDVSIFGPLTAAYQCLVTELAPHLAATGINKVQFGTLYAQAQAKVLTSAAAMRAFQDSGMTTTHPVPEKVLNQLVGLANPPCQTSVAQLAAELPAPIPWTPDALDTALTAVRNAKDAQDLWQPKHPVLEVFHAERLEKEEAQVKVVLLEAQVE